MSELFSVILFVASIVIYACKAGRNTFWYLALLLVLGLFIILNATLYASNYFTGEGINDAVLYTLTNSLTGAGVSKYVLPGIGLVLALFLVFCLLSGCCGDAAIGRTISATACWRCCWRSARLKPRPPFSRWSICSARRAASAIPTSRSGITCRKSRSPNRR